MAGSVSEPRLGAAALSGLAKRMRALVVTYAAGKKQLVKSKTIGDQIYDCTDA
jgi:hypothetical protein